MKRAIYIICLIAGMATTSASAIQLPSHYPDEGFNRIGFIDSISFETRQIVIDDMVYILDDEVVLHSFSSESDSLGRLIKGYQLGFDFTSEGSQRYIHEIWLLPTSYKPTRDAIKAHNRTRKPGLLK